MSKVKDNRAPIKPRKKHTGLGVNGGKASIQEIKHPGTVLGEMFMYPLGFTGSQLALALNVPQNRISQILKGERAVSAETALRLAKLFDNTPQFWLELQSAYELYRAEKIWNKAINEQVRTLQAPYLRKVEASLQSLTSSTKRPSTRGSNRGSRQSEQSQKKKQALSRLAPSERKIHKLLPDKDPIYFDLLHDKSGMQVGELRATLTMLELFDLAIRHPGDHYSKS